VEAVGSRIHLRSAKEHLIPRPRPLSNAIEARGLDPTPVPAVNDWLRGLLGFALFSAVCLPIEALSAPPDLAETETNVTSSAALARADSLHVAWADALAAAHRFKVSGKSANGASGAFPIAGPLQVPATIAERGYASPQRQPSLAGSLPRLPAFSVAMDQPLWAGQLTATLPLFNTEPVASGLGAARAARKTAQAEGRRKTLDLKLSVADAYVNVLRATRSAQRAAASAARLAAQAQIVSNQYDPGSAAVEARAAALSAQRAKAMEAVSLQVCQTSSAVTETRRRMETTHDALLQAEQTLKAVRDQHHHGIDTNRAVLGAEVLRAQCLRNQDNALYDAVMAVFKLRHAVGNL